MTFPEDMNNMVSILLRWYNQIYKVSDNHILLVHHSALMPSSLAITLSDLKSPRYLLVGAELVC